MKQRDVFHLPKLEELGEFGRSEFRDAISDIRSALIEEGWFDRTTSSVSRSDEQSHIHTHVHAGEDRGEAGKQHADDPFDHRWSASDRARQREDRGHPQELDFDR